MIASGYTLDLYCDRKGCKRGAYGNPRAQQFSDESKAVCRRLAKRAGWHVDYTKGAAVCPGCAREAR